MESIRKTPEMPPRTDNTLRFNRMKLNGMIFFSSEKVENPPAVVPSLTRMMNQE